MYLRRRGKGGKAEQGVEGLPRVDPEGRGHDEEPHSVHHVGRGEGALEGEREAREGREGEHRGVEQPLGQPHHHHPAHHRGHVGRDEPVVVVVREAPHGHAEDGRGQQRGHLQQPHREAPAELQAVHHEEEREGREQLDAHGREGARREGVMAREHQVVGREGHGADGAREADRAGERAALRVGDVREGFFRGGGAIGEGHAAAAGLRGPVARRHDARASRVAQSPRRVESFRAPSVPSAAPRGWRRRRWPRRSRRGSRGTGSCPRPRWRGRR